MTDVPNGSLQFAGEGTPPDASNTHSAPNQPGGGEQQIGDGPKYITLEDAQALFDSLFDRKAQSIGDKAAHRVQKVLAAAQAQGLALTQQQAESLVETFDAQPQQPQQQPPAQPAALPQRQPAQAPKGESQAEPEEIHPVLQTAYAMMQKAGVTIEKDDPEMQTIDHETTDEFTFLTSVRQAIQAKQERLAKAGDPARIPSLSGPGRPANAVQQIKDPNELWKLATQGK